MGSKLVTNNTGSNLGVTFHVRQGDDPSTPSVTDVSATIPAGKSQQVDYGSQPFLNGISLKVDSSDSQSESTLIVNSRGSGNTLDAQLNTHNTLAIGYNAETRSFALKATNS